MAVIEEIRVTENRVRAGYREAVKWFDIWGKVVKERVVTGDPAAVPSFSGIASRGGESSPSDPSGSLMTFTDVEMFLAAHATPRQKVLAAFIHAFGVEEGVVSVVYRFADGSLSGSLPLSAERPVQAVDAEYSTRRRTIYDLSRFPAAEVDEFCRQFGWDKEDFLSREHRRLLVYLTRAKGLDPR